MPNSGKPVFNVAMHPQGDPRTGMQPVRDGVPMNRDRIVELVMAVCIIAVLHGLYILHNYALPGKARMVAAFEGKSADEKPLLETFAVEGDWDNAGNGEIVSLVNLKNGKVAGLKFIASGNSMHMVNWKCSQATVQEIAHAMKSLPDKSAKEFQGLEPVELAYEYGFNVCTKGKS
jgi:hypothetical protein